MANNIQSNNLEYTGHGINTGGLQEHSIGDDYPFTVIGTQLDCNSPTVYYVANLNTGWKDSRFFDNSKLAHIECSRIAQLSKVNTI